MMSRAILAMMIALAASMNVAFGVEVCGVPTGIDGDTLRVGSTKFRLDGIDAPEPEQNCLNEAGELWDCGRQAGKRLADKIGGREVCCEDKGLDWKHPDRRIGVCRVGQGDDVLDLHRWLVREGWAIDFMPYSCERFKRDESNARQEGRGVWEGCVVAPRAFRYSDVGAPLLGNKCPLGEEKIARARLLGIEETGPGGCIIKGRAHRYFQIRTVGIYHTPGCARYRATRIDTTRGDRWFCSEGEAAGAGFRRARNCKRQGVPPKSAVKCRW